MCNNQLKIAFCFHIVYIFLAESLHQVQDDWTNYPKKGGGNINLYSSTPLHPFLPLHDVTTSFPRLHEVVKLKAVCPLLLYLFLFPWH